MEPYKIIFFGTSDFANPSLRALTQDSRFEIVAVVTQPDRPVGRHAVLTAPPLKEAAQKLGITTIQQPEKIKDENFQTWIRDVGSSCACFVVVSYGKILPQWLLDLPQHGVINVHGSLLPRWRGASPIQAAIAAGDTLSGVTIMKIDAEMDHGPILKLVKEWIQPNDTGGALHDRLASLGGQHIAETLVDHLEGRLKPEEQDHAKMTLCKILTRDDGKIHWHDSALNIERLIRAYTPWPGTWFEWKGKRTKILRAEVSASELDKKPGEILTVNNHLLVACGNHTTIEILELQPEGKQPMTALAWINGLRD